MAGLDFEKSELFGTGQVSNKGSALGDGRFELVDIARAIGLVGGNFVAGGANMIEGIIDAVGGTIANILGNEETAKRIYKNSWSDDIKSGLTGGINIEGALWNTVGEVSHGAGSMTSRIAIAVGIAALTGGLGAGAAGGVLATGAGKATIGSLVKAGLMSKASYGLLLTSAYGGGMAQAVNTTGQIGVKEHLYGIGSAALELGTEKMFGFANGISNGLADNVSKSIIKNATVRGLIGEGIEEMVAEAVNPYVQRATIDKNAKNATVGEILKAGFMGAAVAGVVGGASNVSNKYNATRVGNKIINSENGKERVNDIVSQGEAYNLPLANSLRALEKDRGRKPTASQVGRLVQDINAKKMEESVAKVAKKYGVNEEKAKKRYVNELALEVLNNEADGKLFASDDVSASAVKAYTEKGGELTNLDMANTISNYGTKNVKYVYEEGQSNAWIENGTDITINLASKKLPTVNATHEVVHTMDKVTIREMFNNIAKSDELFAKKVIGEYKKHELTKNYTKEQREEEVVARYMEKLITDPKTMIKEIEGNITLGNKVLVFFKGFKKLKDKLPKEERDRINGIYDGYVNALALARAKKEIASERNSLVTAKNKNDVNRREGIKQFSILKENGKQFILIDNKNINIFNGVDAKNYTRVARMYIVDYFNGHTLSTSDGKDAYISKKSASEFTHSATALRANNYKHKLLSVVDLMDMIKIANYIESKPDDGRHPFAKDGWDYYKTRFAFSGKDGDLIRFVGEVNIAKNGNKRLFYDVTKIKQLQHNTQFSFENEKGASPKAVSNTIIRKTSEKVNSEKENNSNRQYSLTEDYAEQVESALKNQLGNNTDVLISKVTPQILLDCGLKNLPILITQKHLRNISTYEDGIHSEYHGITKEQIKMLPKLIAKPVAVMDSISVKGGEKSIVVITSEIDNKNRPIIVAIKVDGRGRYAEAEIDSNFVKSFYGKDGFSSFFNKHINENSILFVSKEKSHKLFRELQVQFPQTLNNFDFNTIIRKTLEKVNSEKESNSNVQYSVAKTYKEQVSEYLESKHSNKDFLFVNYPTEQLVKLGKNENAVLVAPSVIDKAQEKHGLSNDIILKLDEMIKKPLMIMKSQTVENSLIFFSEELVDGENIIVAIDTQGYEGFRKINRVSSFYAKQPSLEFVKKNAKNILWIDIKKGQEWLHSRGLQLPNENTTNDLGYIIRKTSKKVNSEKESNSNRKYSLNENTLDEGSEVGYNKEKGVSENGEGSSVSSENQRWENSRLYSGRTQALLRKAGERAYRGRDSSEKRVREKMDGRIRTATTRNVEIDLIELEHLTTFELELKALVNSELKLEIQFFEGSARPKHIQLETKDDGYDGFFDNETRTIYVRSDSSTTIEEVLEEVEHENLHSKIATNRDSYNIVAKYLKDNISINNASDAMKIYEKLYSATYSHNFDRIVEEFIVDIIIGRYPIKFENETEASELIEKLVKNGDTQPITQYSLADIEKYNEVAYNSYGWVLVNEVLTVGNKQTGEYGEYAEFNKKWSEAKNGKGQFPRTKSGEHIISAGNKLVYVSGSYQLPKISKVLELNYGDETNNDIVRNKIYEYERSGYGSDAELLEIAEDYIGQGIICAYKSKDRPSYQESKAEWRRQQGGKASNEANRNYPNGKPRGYNYGESDKDSGRDGKGSELNNKSTKQYSIDSDIKNINKFKTFSKKDAVEVFEDLAFEALEKFGIKITGKGATTEEILNLLNTVPLSKSESAISSVASFIVNCSIVKSLEVTEEQRRLYDIVNTVRECVKKQYDLTDIKDELEYRYGKNQAKGLILSWSRKGGKGIDTIADIQDNLIANGIDIGESANAADIFNAIKGIYDNATNQLLKMLKASTTEYLGKEQIAEFKKTIAKNIKEGYKKGLDSEIRRLRKQITDDRNLGNLKVDMLMLKNRAAEFSKRKYATTASIGNPEFMEIVKRFSKIMPRGSIDNRRVLEFLRVASGLYTEDRLNLEYMSETRNKIDSLLAEIKMNMVLSTSQIHRLKKIGSGLIHLYSVYDAALINGKREAVLNISKEIVNEDKSLPNVKFPLMYAAFKEIIDPNAAFMMMTGYNERSKLMWLYNDIAKGDTEKDIIYAELMSEVDRYIKKDKYVNALEKNNIKFMNKEIPLKFAISLYLTSKREAAVDRLYNSGVSITINEKIGQVNKKRYNIAEGEMDVLYAAFSDEDKEFIKVLERAFLKAKENKVGTDVLRLGYSNVGAGFYFPIYSDKDALAKSLLSEKSFNDSLNSSVNNLSMNKALVENAKAPLEIPGIMTVVEMHMRQVSMYKALAIPLDNFNKVWNKNIGDARNPISVRSVISARHPWSGKYISDLMKNVQGIKEEQGFWQKGINKFRSLFAVSALGGNIKVFITQFASYPMAATFIKPKYLSRAMTTNIAKKLIFEASPFLKIRAKEFQLAKAESVTEKIGKFGEFLMKPISKVDEFTVNKIFVAAALQTAEENNLELKSPENLKLATELCETAVRRTQPMYNQSERTAMMRSPNEIVKSLAMFTSAPVKQLSVLVVNAGKFAYAKAAYKEGKISKEEYNIAKSELAMASASVVTSMVMYSVISLAILNLLGRRDDEENFINAFFEMMDGAIAGMFPILRDAYNYFLSGYEVENFLYGTFNNFLMASKAVFELPTKMLEGEKISKSDIKVLMNKVLRSIGQLTGLPIGNIKSQIDAIDKKYIKKAEEVKKTSKIIKTLGLDFDNAPLKFE